MPAFICAQFLVVALCLVLAASAAGGQRSIHLRDLGTPAGTVGSAATAINNRGEVVGEAALVVGDIAVNVPFLWTPKGGFDLFLGETRGGALDINDRGEVVGNFASGEEAHGFVWSRRSAIVDLGRNVFPVAINNRGQVAAQCVISGVSRACLWDRGFLIPLEIPFGDVRVLADINARGQVIGFACSDSCTGWRWTPNKGAVALRVNPQGLNNRGQIVGRHLDTGRGVIVSTRGTIVRKSPSGYVWYAINSRGWAVGIGLPPSEQWEFATLWYPNGTIVTLPGPTESVAIDVNERGQIAGTATFSPTAVHAVIWTVRGGRARAGRKVGQYAAQKVGHLRAVHSMWF